MNMNMEHFLLSWKPIFRTLFKRFLIVHKVFGQSIEFDKKSNQLTNYVVVK
jgi:hypothetical protein